jgi:hypothetical protein
MNLKIILENILKISIFVIIIFCIYLFLKEIGWVSYYFDLVEEGFLNFTENDDDQYDDEYWQEYENEYGTQGDTIYGDAYDENEEEESEDPYPMLNFEEISPFNADLRPCRLFKNPSDASYLCFEPEYLLDIKDLKLKIDSLQNEDITEVNRLTAIYNFKKSNLSSACFLEIGEDWMEIDKNRNTGEIYEVKKESADNNITSQQPFCLKEMKNDYDFGITKINWNTGGPAFSILDDTLNNKINNKRYAVMQWNTLDINVAKEQMQNQETRRNLIAHSLPGLALKYFDNSFFEGDASWFENKNWTHLSVKTDIDTSKNIRMVNSMVFSCEYQGVIFASSGGEWVFDIDIGQGNSGGSSNLTFLNIWIGNKALNGYKMDNRDFHYAGNGMSSFKYIVTSGFVYPLRIQYGSQNGADMKMDINLGSNRFDLKQMMMTPKGTHHDFPCESAIFIKEITGTVDDGIYYIRTLKNKIKPTYCLMDNKWNGGGWMLMMKMDDSVKNDTFGFYSDMWTNKNSTLNEKSLNLTENTNSKFEVSNSVYINDVMSLWDGVGKQGGSIPNTGYWTWLVNNYYNQGKEKLTLLDGFSEEKTRIVDISGGDPLLFDGYDTSIWSYQKRYRTARLHVFGGGKNFKENGWARARWGFLFNENMGRWNWRTGTRDEGNLRTIDVAGGIGLYFRHGGLRRRHGKSTVSMSAGDLYGCCGHKGKDRSMKCMLFGR